MPTLIQIFSSREALQRAESLKEAILGKKKVRKKGNVKIKVWDQQSDPGDHLDLIIQRIERANLVICLFEPDDKVTRISQVTESKKPRDNVVLEYGLALGLKRREEVIAIVPTNADSDLLVAIPSNLGGSELQPYERSEREDDTEQYSIVAKAIVELFDESDDSLEEADVVQTPPKKDKSPHSDNYRLDLPVTYRSLSDNTDWFELVYNSFKDSFGTKKTISMRSEILYYGPGTAQWWIKKGTNSPANAAQRVTFTKFVDARLGDLFHNSSNEVTVVDMGVGDYRKTGNLIQHLVANRGWAVTFVPFDISGDILADSLQKCRNSISEQLHQKGGSLFAINDRFQDLGRYQALISSSNSRLFLLLGNTLGNEEDETDLLNNIRDQMGEKDRLLIEVQLTDNKQFDVAELEEEVQSEKEFYAATFTVCGIPLDRLKLTLNHREEADKTESYEFVISLEKDTPVLHPAIRDRYLQDQRKPLLRKGKSFRTYLVRKFNLKKLRESIRRSGLQEIFDPAELQHEGRKFAYLFLRRGDE